MTRVAVFIVCLLLASCTKRAHLVLVPEAARTNAVETVFVATSRAYHTPLYYSWRRAEHLSWLRYDIAVPPDRTLGELSWPLNSRVDPNTQFVATRADNLGDGNGYRQALAGALRQLPRAEREVIIYVHGFNNNFADGILRLTQLSHDFDGTGIATHYSWPSAGHPLGYAYDRDSVLLARDGLEQMIHQTLSAGAERVYLIGHSMGSQLIMEVLRAMSLARPGSVDDLFDGVILISPDIDVDVFLSQARRIGELPQPFDLVVSKRDRVLELSARLTGQQNRLGNVASLDRIAGLNVRVIDVSAFSTGPGHFTLGTSPGLIKLFSNPAALRAAFEGDAAGRPGLLPGTILTVRNATGIILQPAPSANP